MQQLHKRFSDHQVAFLLQSYSRGLLTRREIQDTLKVGKTRFFELWKDYKDDPDGFSIITSVEVAPGNRHDGQLYRRYWRRTSSETCPSAS